MKIIFTNHSNQRTKKRNITKEEVIDTINYSQKIIIKYDKIYYQKNIGRGEIEVVAQKTENVLKIITVYWI